jgi:hypothetical protein
MVGGSMRKSRTATHVAHAQAATAAAPATSKERSCCSALSRPVSTDRRATAGGAHSDRVVAEANVVAGPCSACEAAQANALRSCVEGCAEVAGCAEVEGWEVAVEARGA